MITFDFSGKTIVVTGAGRGIGKQIAHRFALSGGNVAVCRRSSLNLDKLEFDILEKTSDVLVKAYSADVNNIGDMNQFFDTVVAEFGQIDILINNAGIMTSEDIADITPDQFDKVINTNLKSMLFTSQWFANYHRQHKTAGSIVNIASVSSVTYIPENLLYNLSKSGVVTLTKTFARALGPDNIRVNAVGPGSTPTDLNAKMYADPDKERALCDKLPLGRRATKDDIANCVMFLASEEAGYVTGQVLYAEGGWLLV